MRVCQFRHYGTVFYAPHRGPEHANRESLVLQTERRLSIAVDHERIKERTGGKAFETQAKTSF
jgi:hypothetical protein